MLISSLNSLLGVTEAPLPTSASGISRDKASETSLNEAFSLDLSPAARKAGQAASAEKNTSLIVKANQPHFAFAQYRYVFRNQVYI